MSNLPHDDGQTFFCNCNKAILLGADFVSVLIPPLVSRLTLQKFDSDTSHSINNNNRVLSINSTSYSAPLLLPSSAVDYTSHYGLAYGCRSNLSQQIRAINIICPHQQQTNWSRLRACTIQREHLQELKLQSESEP